MTLHIGPGQVDQLHAAGKDGFAAIRRHVELLRAQGAGDEEIVGHMVSQVGTRLLERCTEEDQETFWGECWAVCASLAYGALRHD